MQIIHVYYDTAVHIINAPEVASAQAWSTLYLMPSLTHMLFSIRKLSVLCFYVSLLGTFY